MIRNQTQTNSLPSQVSEEGWGRAAGLVGTTRRYYWIKAGTQVTCRLPHAKVTQAQKGTPFSVWGHLGATLPSHQVHFPGLSFYPPLPGLGCPRVTTVMQIPKSLGRKNWSWKKSLRNKRMDYNVLLWRVISGSNSGLQNLWFHPLFKVGPI